VIDTEKKLVKLEGKWSENLFGKWLEDTEFVQKNEIRSLWKIDMKSFLNDQYNYTQFTVSLNRMTETEEFVVLPSDSRRRLDRKYLEKGNTDTATYWKKLIEDRQRLDRKSRKIPWQPIWFRKEEQVNPFGNVSTVWIYDSDFWEQRTRKEESVRQGDIQFILKLNPPQLVNSACDFTSYDNSNYLQLIAPPKTDNTVIVLTSNDELKQETSQLHAEVNGSTEISGNETNHSTPEKTEKDHTTDDTLKQETSQLHTEVNGITEISGNETQV